MKTADVILYGALGVLGYLVYLKYNQPTTQIQVKQALSNAGLNSYQSDVISNDSENVYAVSGNDTYKFFPGDFDKLNLAQKILIGADRVIPGTWLTRWVLT